MPDPDDRTLPPSLHRKLPDEAVALPRYIVLRCEEGFPDRSKWLRSQSTAGTAGRARHGAPRGRRIRLPQTCPTLERGCLDCAAGRHENTAMWYSELTGQARSY